MRGNTIENTGLLNKINQNRAKNKIVGEINDINFTLKLLSLGIDRIGASSGKITLKDFKELYQS